MNLSKAVHIGNFYNFLNSKKDRNTFYLLNQTNHTNYSNITICKLNNIIF